MRGRLWLDNFVKIVDEEGDEKLDFSTDTDWTAGMMTILDQVGKELGCDVIRKRPDAINKEDSGEYLTIDVMFFDEKESAEYIFPRVVIEHENSKSVEKIEYCLWKILCIRSPIRVLICYQDGEEKVEALRKHLENNIWNGSLMKGDSGDLIVLIGNEIETDYWGEYFKTFEWRNDRLEEIKELKWDGSIQSNLL
ncbi:MAG: hypothetical protein GQ533_10945 [Methanosarcinaceae archaeon]|nr:hypothetical protein [Methanosarcinaceae archaeon]